MNFTARDLLQLLDTLTPLRLAEEWDNSGFIAGNPQQQVSGVLTALDLSSTVLKEAVEKRCNVIVTHHPTIFHPLKQLLTDTGEGRLLQEVLRRELVIIASHTSFDNAAGGVSDHLADLLHLTHRRPLMPNTEEGCGCGSIGRFAEPLSGDWLLKRIIEVLNLPGVSVAGPIPEQVEVAALCGGSGSPFARAARAAGAQLYLCGELKHDTAIWAREEGFCIVDAGHYATEKPAMSLLTRRLNDALAAQAAVVPVMESELEKSPVIWRGREN